MRALLAALALLLSVGLALAQEPAPRMGGVLKVAMIGEPPSLDLHTTTATITQHIMGNVYEGLFAYDKAFQPVPMLAESHIATDGGRRYTITLRKGVRFHNGKELTSADVVASLNRWGKTATLGKTTWRNVEGIEAKDPSTVVIHLKQPSGALLFGLAEYNNAAAIYPKEIVDAAGDGQVKEFIGTGPFRFVEHKPDRHIKLARFKDYSARAEPSNGMGGKRVAYVDEILFMPVPDVAVRLAGVETGEYHFGQQIKQDQYDRIKSLPALEARIVRPSGWSAAILNHKEGVMTSKKVRQAFQAALDMEPIMAAGFGNKEFYRLDGSVVFVEQPAWHSTAGVAAYNQKDKEKARRLLKEAGYTGQPVRWITTREYEWMYKNALVAKQQLEEAGFKVDLQVVDWATLVQRRNKPELYDVFSTGLVFNAFPPQASGLQCNWPGWWCLEEKDKLLADMAAEPDAKKRKAMLDRVQVLFYEDVGRVKFGDYFSLDVARKDMRGDFRASLATYFYNVWLAR
jgi:peptide/nickel transport system substrate-binding protein